MWIFLRGVPVLFPQERRNAQASTGTVLVVNPCDARRSILYLGLMDHFTSLSVLLR